MKKFSNNDNIIKIPIEKIKEYIDIPEEELEILDSITISIESLNKKKEIQQQNTVTIPVYDIKKELEKFSFDKNENVIIPISKKKESNLQQTISVSIEEIKKELEKADNNLSDTITISIDEIKNKLNEYKHILEENNKTEELIQEKSYKKDILDIYIEKNNNNNDEKTLNIPIEKIQKNLNNENINETIIIPIDNIETINNNETNKELNKTIEIPKDLIIDEIKDNIKKKKRNKKIIGILILVILILISISLIYNFFIWNNNNKYNKDFKELQTNTTTKETNQNNINNNINNNDIDNKFINNTNIAFLDVDLKESIDINKETIGWIKINNTDINHPFVQTNNNDYYQNHSFYQTNSSGWMYLDFKNNFKNIDKNNVLYADINKKSTQFSSLKNIIEPEWYKNSENKNIKISSLNSNSIWEIFSVYTTDKDTYSQINFDKENSFNEFYNNALINSFNNFNVNINQNDKILTIVTYFDKDLKLVIHAKLLSLQEKGIN